MSVHLAKKNYLTTSRSVSLGRELVKPESKLNPDRQEIIAARRESKACLEKLGVLAAHASSKSIDELFGESFTNLNSSEKKQKLVHLANIINLITVIMREEFNLNGNKRNSSLPNLHNVRASLLGIGIKPEYIGDIINICIHEGGSGNNGLFGFSTETHGLFGSISGNNHTGSAQKLYDNVNRAINLLESNKDVIKRPDGVISHQIMTKYFADKSQNKDGNSDIEILLEKLNDSTLVGKYARGLIAMNDGSAQSSVTPTDAQSPIPIVALVNLAKSAKISSVDDLAKFVSDTEITDGGKSNFIQELVAKEVLSLGDGETKATTLGDIAHKFGITSTNTLTDLAGCFQIDKAITLGQFANGAQINDADKLSDLLESAIINTPEERGQFAKAVGINEIGKLIEFVNAFKIESPEALGLFVTGAGIITVDGLVEFVQKLNLTHDMGKMVAFVRHAKIDDLPSFIQKIGIDKKIFSETMRAQQINKLTKLLDYCGKSFCKPLLEIAAIGKISDDSPIAIGDPDGSHGRIAIAAIQAGKMALDDKGLENLSVVMNNEAAGLDAGSNLALKNVQSNKKSQEALNYIEKNAKYLSSDIPLIIEGDFVHDRASLDKECEQKMREKLKDANWDSVIYIRGNHDSIDEYMLDLSEEDKKLGTLSEVTEKLIEKYNKSGSESDQTQFGLYANCGNLTIQEIREHEKKYFQNAYYHEKTKTLHLHHGVKLRFNDDFPRGFVETVFGNIWCEKVIKFVELINNKKYTDLSKLSEKNLTSFRPDPLDAKQYRNHWLITEDITVVHGHNADNNIEYVTNKFNKDGTRPLEINLNSLANNLKKRVTTAIRIGDMHVVR